jgi:hypothetical protein
VLGTVVGAAALMATGCGNLTIRSWVKVITATSTGSVQSPFLGTDPVQFARLQGGFLGRIVLDTRTIPAPVDGTLTVEDVRIGGISEILSTLCVWGNSALTSSGTVHLDILGGSGSATTNLNVKATTGLSDMAGFPPVELSQAATFPLNGVGISQLLNAASTGSPDGLFATSASFNGETVLFGAPAVFALSLNVTNESKPPLFDADVLAGCGAHFNEQGRDIFYGINSKSSYLLASGNDTPTAPLVIKLSDLGAHAGDTLKLARVGTYDDTLELKDGTLTKVGAVFSSSATVNAGKQRNRIPGAIDAGTDVTTGSYQKCIIWPFCTTTPTDITQDFAITSGPTVTIPTGALYLIVAPIPDSLSWGDNSGFGLGVAVTVNP